MTTPPKIIDRHGWKHVRIRRERGSGSAVMPLHTKSMETARQLVAAGNMDKLAIAAQGDLLGREMWTRLVAGAKVTVANSLEAYEIHRYTIGQSEDTIIPQARVLDAFVRRFELGNQPIATVTPQMVADFVNAVGKAKLSTREWWLVVLSGWLAFCVERRWIAINPAADIRVRVDALEQEQLVSEPHEAFTDAEVQALLATIPKADFWHGAVLLAYTYGLRIGTIVRLEEGCVVARRIRVFARKGRKVMDEPLTDEMQAWLELWATQRPASDLPYVFPAQAAAPGSSLRTQFSRWCAKAGLEKTSIHGIRKTATARRWEEEMSALGPKATRVMAGLLAQHGLQKVQAMLTHGIGSDVTTKHYFEKP